MNDDRNLPPGVTGNEDHIQGGDPRFDAEAERFALAMGDQLDALYDDHQEEIIRLGTEHILLRLDEEARGPDVLDLSDIDDGAVERIRAAIDEWRGDPARCLAMVVLDGSLADEVPRVLKFLDENPKPPVMVLNADGIEKVRHALAFVDGAVCALHDDDTTGARPVSDRLAEVMGELFAAFGMDPPVAATWGRKPFDPTAPPDPADGAMWRTYGLFESQGKPEELTIGDFAENYEVNQAKTALDAAKVWAETQDPMCYDWGDEVVVMVAPDTGGQIMLFRMRMSGAAETSEPPMIVGTFEVEDVDEVEF